MKLTNLIILSVTLTVVTSNAQLTLINFDEFDTSSGRVRIPNGYNGLNWSNFFAFHQVGSQANGFVTGVISPLNDAFNGGGVPADISSTAPFSLESGYFTAAYNNGLSLEVQGYNGNTLLYDQTYTLNVAGPSYIVFNFSDITDAHFISSGGVEVGLGSGYYFAVDNLTIAPVPEPSTLGLAGLSCLSLLLYVRKAVGPESLQD